MKKILLIGLTVLLIAGAVVGILAIKGEDTAGGTGTISGTIKVPDGPRIKVINKTGLKEIWEKMGMEGFQLHLVGTLRNDSDQAIKFSEIAFLLDGKQVAYITGRTLQPREMMPVAVGIVGYSEDTKVLEMEIRNLQIIGGAAPQASKLSTPEPPSQTDGKTFTSAPKNPQTPAEVVAAFYFLMDAKKYSEAAKYINIPANMLEKEFSSGKTIRPGQLESVGVRFVDEGGIGVTLFFKNGDAVDATLIISEGKIKE